MQQSHSLDFKLVQRVCLLQQALDQALESLEDLAAQVQDKHWVETQLASTEKYANVQQQAITHLKQQLAQFTEIQDHLLGVMSFRLNELIDQQQQAFNHLNIQFQQSHTELQTYLQYLTQQQQTAPAFERGSEEHHLALEAEVMVARSMAVHLSQYLGQAKQHLNHLNDDLGNHHLNLGQIIKTIQSMIADLTKFDSAQATIQPQGVPAKEAADDSAGGRSLLSPAADEAPDATELAATVRRQNARIQELQAILTEHVHHETHLRQRYQELAAERDFYRRELQKLQQSQAAGQGSRLALPAPMLGGEAEPAGQPAPPTPLKALRRSRPSQPIQPLRLPDA